MKLKRIAVLAMLTAMACVLSYLESFIPVFIPGVKLGLANVVLLIMIYEFKFYESLTSLILRIVVVALIRGTLLTPTFLMSLSGGLCAYLVMLLFSRIKVFSPIGVSVLGSLSHGCGQILVAMIVMGTGAVIYYLPFILLLSLGCGMLSGFIGRTYLKRSITYKFIDGDRKQDVSKTMDEEEKTED